VCRERRWTSEAVKTLNRLSATASVDYNSEKIQLLGAIMFERYTEKARRAIFFAVKGQDERSHSAAPLTTSQLTSRGLSSTEEN
jgi:hypothetical protein